MLTLDLVREGFVLLVRDESLAKRDYLSGTNNIFVCGSLMDPGFVAQLVEHPVVGAFAVARGYARGYDIANGEKNHFMKRKKDGVLPGMAWLELSEEDVRKFERFERVPELRRRVDLRVRVGDRVLPAFTYLRNTGSRAGSRLRSRNGSGNEGPPCRKV